MANDVERRSLLTMYAMRGYALSEDGAFWEAGKKELAEVNRYLDEAQAPCREIPGPGQAQGGRGPGPSPRRDEYARLAEETNPPHRRFGQGSGGPWTRAPGSTCGSATTSWPPRTRPWKGISTRAWGGTSSRSGWTRLPGSIDVIDLGNDVRVKNFKSQVTRNPALIQAALENFPKIDVVMEKMRGITRLEVNIKQLNAIVDAGNRYCNGHEGVPGLLDGPSGVGRQAATPWPPRCSARPRARPRRAWSTPRAIADGGQGQPRLRLQWS